MRPEKPGQESGARPQPGAGRRRVFAAVAFAVLAGMAAVEIQNSLRLVTSGNAEGPVPYASRGILSLSALVRPLDRFSSDIQPSLFAARNLLQGGEDLYGAPSSTGGDFIYPPTAALEFLPLGVVAWLAGFPVATAIADLLFRIVTIGSMLLAVRSLQRCLAGWRTWLWAGVLLYAFFPLRWMLIRVQAQTIVTFLLLAAMASYGDRRDRRAGLLIGLAACIKPHLALLLLFGAARRNLRLIRWGAAGCLAVALASLLAAGLEPWKRYMGDVLPRIGRGYAAHANQSPAAVVYRWLGYPATFDTPSSSVFVTVAIAAGFALFLVLALWPRRAAPTAAARSADFGIAVLSLTIASPIAWEHHYAWTIGLFALTVCLLLDPHGGIARPNGPDPAKAGRLPWLLGLAYVLLGSYWVPFAGASRGLASLAQSLPLAGACLLLATSWRAVAATVAPEGAEGRSSTR